jgi:hypothetical protein
MTFYVPINAKATAGWHRVKSHGAYAGDYIATHQGGAVLTVATVKGIRELRVIAPTGAKLGTIAVRVGHSSWMKVKLTSAHAKSLRVFVVRKGTAKPISGPVQVRALKVPPGGAVAVDAIVAR